jgi:hypothetical protein
MSHTRPENDLLTNWNSADTALLEIIQIRERVAKQELIATRRKAQIDEVLKSDTQADVDRLKLLELALERFTTSRRDEFAPRKSKRLQHGTVGFRTSTKIEFDQDEADVIDAIRTDRDFDEGFCLRSKVWADKKALADYSDEQLERIGADRVVVDRFFYNPNKTDRADTSGAKGAR